MLAQTEKKLHFYPPVYTMERAREIAWKLSAPGKMPHRISWGIPTDYCQEGIKLRAIKGTICSFCYACRGRVRANNWAYQRRYEGIFHPQWVEAMVYLIGQSVPIGDPYFRWFDSGDIQGMGHLLKIFEVCERLPMVKFWLPTQEYALLRRVKREGIRIPKNVLIRVSSRMPDGRPPKEFPHTSSVTAGEDFNCPASLQGNRCQSCRKCWDESVAHVVYHQH